MVTESEFSKAVEEFKIVLKDVSMTEKIESVPGIDKAINSLSVFLRVELKDFSAIPDSLLGIQNHVKDFRNWKKQNDPGFEYVNQQKERIVVLIKNYLDELSQRQYFGAMAW